MTSTKAAVRNIILNCENYCCLCLHTVAENDILYYLQDEVIIETETVEDLYETLFAVLGEEVMDSLSTDTICEKCTKTVINSYKFIEMCKNNVRMLAHNINSLENCVKKKTLNNIKEKSLFLTLDTNNYKVDYYYDKEQQDKTHTSLLKRFNNIQKKPFITSVCNYLTIDIESDPYHSDAHHELLELPISSPHNDVIKKKNLTANISKTNTNIIQDVVLRRDMDVENSYKCESCLKMYPTKLKLNQHYLRVHAPKNFQCSKCPRSFGTLLILNRHIKESHCTAVCSRCGKTYTNAYSLRYHERSHDKIHLVCQTCGKVYKGKQAFKNHIERKLCEEPVKAEAKFTCNYCAKRYTQKAALTVHIRLQHENGKAVICDWCGKKLSSDSRLRDHILTHTKQKNFSCDICDGKFVTKASLLYHTRTHTGEKPYKCDQCDMRFLSASRRSEHVKRHHGGSDVECDICNSKFKGQTLLKKHRKRHFNVSSRLYHVSN